MMNRLNDQSRGKNDSGRRSGAALYTLIVFISMLVGVLGLSALMTSRIERSRQHLNIDSVLARRLATSGIDLARLAIAGDENWRATLSHNQMTSPVPIGDGTLQWAILDTADTDLGDDVADRIVIQGRAIVGGAVQVESVEATPVLGPAEILNSVLHSDQNLTISSGANLIAIDAPATTNNAFQHYGTLSGDAKCQSKTGGGVIAGRLTTDIARLAMPEMTIFDDYRAQATALNFQGDIIGHVLTPGVNTYDTPVDQNGIYYINTGGTTVTVSETRLRGTLIVDGNVILDDAVYFAPANSNMPTLLVNGSLTIQIDSRQSLNESTAGTNFNPPGADEGNGGDSDTNDTYPNEINGLTHASGDLTFHDYVQMNGVVIADGQATVSGTVRIQHDPLLYAIPPTGYDLLPGPKMSVIPGTWKRIADPTE